MKIVKFPMSVIVPAILEQTKPAFDEKADLLVRILGVERIHVDFADGLFVPNKTIPASELDVLNPAFEWEAHLMIENPQDFLDYKIAGFKYIVVHFEAFADIVDLRQAIEEIKRIGAKPGIAINPSTAIAKLYSVRNLADYFMIMSVNPGFQGAAFVKQTPERVTELRKLIPNAIIEVDGSINETTIQPVIQARPGLLVVGSAIVKSADPESAFRKLQAMAAAVTS